MTPAGADPRVHRLVVLALLTAYATALNVLEAPLPRLLPWAKPGLANAASLVALLAYGLPAALTVAAARVLLAGLFLGHLLSPAWWMGAAGALGAPLAMAAARRAAPPLGMASISVAGAATSNGLQLAVASLALAGHAGLMASLPALVGTSIPSGLVVAWLAHHALARLPEPDQAAGARTLTTRSTS